MQYTYNIVEAAALWAGVEPSEITRRMELADNTRIEIEYSKSLENAKQEDSKDRIAWVKRMDICDFQCKLESTCPDWREIETEDGYPRRILKCPYEFNNKPADNPPTPRTVTRPSVSVRLLPIAGEFDDLPDFEQRLGWLQMALSMGDLVGTPEVIRAYDLRAWLQKHFPGLQPEFLVPSVGLNSLAERTSKSPEHQATKIDDQRAAPRVTVNKLKGGRSDFLDPLIDGLISELKTYDSAVIFPALRKMALEEEEPLNGVKDDAILWTDSRNQSKELTYEALEKRMARRIKQLSKPQ